MTANDGKRVALALSGGGFRASLFHVGSLRRLNEMGILPKIDAFSSVSGGSITNGLLAARWVQLKQSEANGVFSAFDSLIAQPIYEFCKKDLRTEVLLWDRVNPINWPRLLRSDYSVTDRLASSYAEALGLSVPLSSLPRSPKFVFCAANLSNGASWEFRAETMGDFYTGWTATGELPVAMAVAASSAYPVTFPPLVLSGGRRLDFLDGHDGSPLSLKSVTLTDGGVYDNLGLEPVNSGYPYLLVSDAGAPAHRLEDVGVNPYSRVTRSLDVIWRQVGSLRKRWLIDAYKSNEHDLDGAYWGIASDVHGYGLEAPGYSNQTLSLLAKFRTDLDSFTDGEIACLENQGYSLANVAIQRWVKPLLPQVMPEFRWPHLNFAEDAAAEVALKHSSERGIVKDLWQSLRNRVDDWVG